MHGRDCRIESASAEVLRLLEYACLCACQSRNRYTRQHWMTSASDSMDNSRSYCDRHRACAYSWEAPRFQRCIAAMIDLGSLRLTGPHHALNAIAGNEGEDYAFVTFPTVEFGSHHPGRAATPPVEDSCCPGAGSPVWYFFTLCTDFSGLRWRILIKRWSLLDC